MNARSVWIGVLAAAVIGVPMVAPALAQPKEMFVPSLVYRTGPYAPIGISIANGFKDYYALLNERDGGIEGVKRRSRRLRAASDAASFQRPTPRPARNAAPAAVVSTRAGRSTGTPRMSAWNCIRKSLAHAPPSTLSTRSFFFESAAIASTTSRVW